MHASHLLAGMNWKDLEELTECLATKVSLLSKTAPGCFSEISVIRNGLKKVAGEIHEMRMMLLREKIGDLTDEEKETLSKALTIRKLLDRMRETDPDFSLVDVHDRVRDFRNTGR